jgi:hypothetical protein
VSEPSTSRHFYRTPPPRASDGRAVVSRKDDGGSCSQVLSTSLATLHAQSKAKVDPVRRLCGNMAPRIDPGARAAVRPPWRDVIPKLGPLQQDLSRRARSEKATCRWSSGGETTPAASKREAGPLASGGAAEEGLRATTETTRISANGTPDLSTSVVVPGGLPRAIPVSAMPKIHTER